MKYWITVPLFTLALSACNEIPKEAYFDRGKPHSLLDVSSEVVNVSLASEQSLDQLVDWVNQDQPTRAELYCLESDPLCQQAQQVLDQFGVPSTYTAAADNLVALMYERVAARDCENRYIDNHINPYHLHHPTFGCSTAVNIVQMVGDKQQFVSPALLDYHDARKAAQVYRRYQEPPAPAEEQSRDSILDVVRTEGD